MQATQSHTFAVRDAVHLALDGSKRERRTTNRVAIVISALILLNVVAAILETMPSLSSRYALIFHGLELASVAVFSAEYLLRLGACTSSSTFRDPVRGRIRYALQPLALIDLLAILPFYLPMFVSLDLRTLRLLRLFRLVRVLKLGRYSESVALFSTVLRTKKRELVLSATATGLLLVVASSLMYAVENPVQPDRFSSIPATMWWGVATLTTVGYGDVVPVTSTGKVLSGIVAVLGVGVFAIPAGVLAAGFAGAVRHGADPNLCPYCGQRTAPPDSDPGQV